MSHSSAYWTVQEVAERLSLSRMTIYRMTRDGTIPSLRIGRSIRIPKDAFDTYLESLKGNHGND